MTNFKKIFCAVDLSEHSACVAEYVASLAKSYDSDVKVVYVAPTFSQYVGFDVPPSSIGAFANEIMTGAEKSMDEFILANLKGVKAIAEVVSGDAADEIVARANSFEADLIVMGTHGRIGIDRIVFGSVAEKVLKTTAIPVMVVKPRLKK